MTGPGACSWIVVETISTEDGPLRREIECGAPTRIDDYGDRGQGWTCSRGHCVRPVAVDLAPGGPAWEDEERERQDWEGGRGDFTPHGRQRGGRGD